MRTLLLPAMACMLLLTSTITFAATSANHPPHVTRYIETYNEIAIREMHRSGIPASVILAQGIHESSWGLGELSTNSNNHFGIKCKSSWTGETYYIKDDDYQNGVLVKSCFRVYNSVDDSYIDHTNFLVEGSRYQTLFNFDRTDYINWSKGLKSCGYATDPNYATKLIRTIEKYNLTQYDEVKPPVISAPVFHLPAPVEPRPQTAIPQETATDVAISSTVNQVIHSTVVETEMEVEKEEEMVPPPPVSIEGYDRNTNRITATAEGDFNNSATNSMMEVEGIEEEEEEEEEMEIIEEEEAVVQNNSTKVLPPPSYQVESLPRTESPKTELPKTEKDLTTTKVEDNHLQVMRGKMRVTRKPRR